MAKITTVTNPLTGQPAQVDQLDHTAQQIDDAIARALPGGAIDITLQNKPSKSPVHVDDANDVTKSGFYTCKTNIPFGYGLANVLAVGDIDDPNNVFTQIAFGVNLNPTNRNAIAVRCYVPSDGFKDWEWFNPPMLLGIEYRTTERYLGKPVYAMLVDCGIMPNSTNKTVYAGISNGESLVDTFGEYYNSTTSVSLPYSSNGTTIAKYSAHISSGSCTIILWAKSDESAKNARVLIKYTKTTD